MPVIGQSRSFHKKFKFVVEIDSFTYSGFRKCGALESETAVIEQYEGGALIPNKSLGRVKFADIMLERGATQDQDMFTWYKQVSNIAANSGLVDEAYKRNVAIRQQDRDGKTLRVWKVKKAFPSKFTAGEWDNDADENVIENITLTYDFFDQ